MVRKQYSTQEAFSFRVAKLTGHQINQMGENQKKEKKAMMATTYRTF
jgi:hypothetical protein